jgi:hypothetical protein
MANRSPAPRIPETPLTSLKRNTIHEQCCKAHKAPAELSNCHYCSQPQAWRMQGRSYNNNKHASSRNFAGPASQTKSPVLAFVQIRCAGKIQDPLIAPESHESIREIVQFGWRKGPSSALKRHSIVLAHLGCRSWSISNLTIALLGLEAPITASRTIICWRCR